MSRLRMITMLTVMSVVAFPAIAAAVPLANTGRSTTGMIAASAAFASDKSCSASAATAFDSRAINRAAPAQVGDRPADGVFIIPAKSYASITLDVDGPLNTT